MVFSQFKIVYWRYSTTCTRSCTLYKEIMKCGAGGHAQPGKSRLTWYYSTSKRTENTISAKVVLINVRIHWINVFEIYNGVIFICEWTYVGIVIATCYMVTQNTDSYSTLSKRRVTQNKDCNYAIGHRQSDVWHRVRTAIGHHFHIRVLNIIIQNLIII